MANLISSSADTQSKVFNLSNDEWQSLSAHLSRDPKIRQDQINFLNNDKTIVYQKNETPIYKSIVNSNKNISPEDVAKTIYDLNKINSLTATIAKSSIGATEFINKQVDSLGSTIFNQIDQLTNAATQGLVEMEHTIQEWQTNAVAAERKIVNNTIWPCTSFAGKALKGISSELVDDLHAFNRVVSKNRLLNVPGDVFNSLRHIAFAVRGELEKLIDFTHQIFAGIVAAMIKLKRLLRKAIKAIVVLLVTLIENLIPVNLLSDIQSSINGVLGALQETFSAFFTNIGLGAQEGIFEGLIAEVTKIAEHPLLYIFDQLGTDIIVNLPVGDSLKKLENNIVNNKIFKEFLQFSNKFTLEYLITKLPPGAQETLKVLTAISSNAHGFIGNGIRNYARKNILKNRTGVFLGKLNVIGVNFTLSAPYHYSTTTSGRVAPILTFQPLLTDNSKQITTDIYGNRVITSYTTTHLY